MAMQRKTMGRMAPKTDEKRDHQLTIRIPKYLRDALDQEANKERRSVADIIVFMLEERFGSKRKGGK